MFTALAIIGDCQTHTPNDSWSYQLWYYTKKPADQQITAAQSMKTYTNIKTTIILL